jgi:hypothetical protein
MTTHYFHETPHTPIRMASIQKPGEFWQDCRATGKALTAVADVKGYCTSLEDSSAVSHNAKRSGHTISSHPPWHLPKWVENLCPREKTCMKMFVAALFIMSKNQSKQNILQWVNRQTNLHPMQHHSGITRSKRGKC